MKRLREGVEWFFTALDSEGVALFQAIVYIHLALGGLYCVFAADATPMAVEEAMGPAANAIWVGLCIGSLVCLLGKWLSAKTHVRPLWIHTTGLHLQLAGDVFALGAFTGYVLATMQTSYWGKALIAVWVFAALADCAALLIVRDVRRIGQAERSVRQ